MFEEADISWFYALHTKDVVHHGQDQRGSCDRSNNSPSDQTSIHCHTQQLQSQQNMNTRVSQKSVQKLTR